LKDKDDATIKRIKKGSVDPAYQQKIDTIKKHLLPLTVVKKNGAPVNQKI
jgi:hypothetical protein